LGEGLDLQKYSNGAMNSERIPGYSMHHEFEPMLEAVVLNGAVVDRSALLASE